MPEPVTTADFLCGDVVRHRLRSVRMIVIDVGSRTETVFCEHVNDDGTRSELVSHEPRNLINLTAINVRAEPKEKYLLAPLDIF